MESNRYDKMGDYIASLFNVFLMAKTKAEQKKDQRFQMISIVIYNYVSYMAKQYNVSLKDISTQDSINLIPIFEYISMNDVELYDFTKINMDDVDITKKEDLERYVLTHVYYITQSNPHPLLEKVEMK
jgi:hypothetical protein